MTNPNLEMLRVAIENLGELTAEMVFVGGCTTGLLITDEGAAEIRATDDVDTIIEVTSYAEYKYIRGETQENQLSGRHS